MIITVWWLRGESPAGRYWFPAKRYGWGWGLPITWQGWLVFAAWLRLVVAGNFLFLLFPPRRALAPYLVYLAVLSVAVIAVCWLKGRAAALAMGRRRVTRPLPNTPQEIGWPTLL